MTEAWANCKVAPLPGARAEHEVALGLAVLAGLLVRDQRGWLVLQRVAHAAGSVRTTTRPTLNGKKTSKTTFGPRVKGVFEDTCSYDGLATTNGVCASK